MKKMMFAFAFAFGAVAFAAGCDMIPGLGGNQNPPPVQPAPLQPVLVQPAPPPVVQPPVLVAPVPTGDALVDKINAKKFAVAPAFIPTSALVKHVFGQDKTAAFQVQLPGPPFCHTFVASAADAVGNVDMAIVSPTGAVESQDATNEASALIANHCPTVPGAYKLTLNAGTPSAEFAVQVFSK